MISTIFNTIFYQPLFNGLVFLIGILPYHDIGLAVIILTIIVRLIIFPFSHKATVTQVKMKQLEPEIKDIKDKFKKDNQEQAKRIMELYKRHGVSPFSGFLILLIQIPIIFALYKVFIAGANFDINKLYYFIHLPDLINTKFLGLIDMTQKSYFLAALAAISQYFQISLSIPKTPKNNQPKQNPSFSDQLVKSMGFQMKFLMPLVVFYIGLKFSSAVALYWTTMNVFAILHEMFVRKRAEKILKYGSSSNSNSKDKNNLGNSA
jgi:YidC/Oxa1 family membrane protein insertase